MPLVSLNPLMNSKKMKLGGKGIVDQETASLVRGSRPFAVIDENALTLAQKNGHAEVAQYLEGKVDGCGEE